MPRSRHKDALLMQGGACNARALVRSLHEHIEEFCKSPEFAGTDSITSDPALRLMVHQIAFLFNTSGIDSGLYTYSNLTKECEVRALQDETKAA
jgi:hypothetical protein